MKYQEYRARGFRRIDYEQLSQWQRLLLILHDWRTSKAPDKGVQFFALWYATNEEADWIREDDWWKVWRPIIRRQWHWGFDQCQNFHHVCLGPCRVLIAT